MASKKSEGAMLNVRQDRKLAWYRGGSVRYVVAEVQAPELPAETAARRATQNVALVLDVSGSMEGEPLRIAKQAAIDAMGRMADGDFLSVVSFSNDAAVHVDGLELNTEVRRTSEQLIQAMETQSSTNLGEGWRLGAHCAARVMERIDGVQSRVILLSDGQANVGIVNSTMLSLHASQVHERGISTSTIGIGHGYSQEQMVPMAEHGGGNHHYAEFAHEIAEVLRGEMEETLATAVDQVRVALESPADVEVDCLSRYPSHFSEGRMTASLGALCYGAKRDVVFQLKLPKGAAGEEVTVAIEAGGEAAAVTFRLVEGEENGAEQRDVEVAERVATVWQLSLVQRALEMNRRNEWEECEALLRSELKWLKKYCEGLPSAKTLLRPLENLLRESRRDWGETSRKEMCSQAQHSIKNRRDHRSAAREVWSAAFERERPEPPTPGPSGTAGSAGRS